jgi:uncharacterized protein
MTEIIKQPIVSTLTATLRADVKSRFVDWQADLTGAIAGREGFVSLEFLSKPETPQVWLIVQRFYNKDFAGQWKASTSYQELIDKLRPLLIQNGLQEQIESEAEMRGGITELIITDVQPDHEDAFREWSARIHQIEAKFDGFRGVYLQSPKGNGGKHWITLLQFDTPAHLDNWLSSPERQEILKEGAPHVTSLETNRMVSPFAGWFTSIAKSEEIPTVWQQTMIVLLILFPIVMLEIKYLSPWTAGLNSSLATFIGNSISVTLIAYPFMPLLVPYLSWWLFPDKRRHFSLTFLGTTVVIALYLLEIAFFWNFM